LTIITALTILFPALPRAQVTVVDTIRLAPIQGNALYPVSVCVNDEYNMVYVANQQSSNVTVIDGNTGRVQEVVHLGGQPYGICVHNEDSFVFVTDYGHDRVFVLDALYNTIHDTISTPDGPWGICVNEETDYLYVTCFVADRVAVYNVHYMSTTSQITTSIRWGISPFPRSRWASA
jgi:YVTN family beta-propeller protein